MSYLPTIPCPNGAVFARAVTTPAEAASRADPRAELLALVSRARDGDLVAQSEIVRLYTKRISAFVRTIVDQSSAIEDVVQLVFIKMTRRLALLRDLATFESWLFVLARNTGLDFLRRKRCRPVLVSDAGEFSHVADMIDARALPEIVEALDAALTRLSPKDRNLVRLIVQGHSYRMAAAGEGLTIGAVKVRLNRVRPFLRASVGGAIGRPVPPVENFRPPPRARAAA